MIKSLFSSALYALQDKPDGFVNNSYLSSIKRLSLDDPTHRSTLRTFHIMAERVSITAVSL